MIRSMTAFASCEANTDSYTLVWEIRSVNHRYLDVSPRLPEIFRSIEPLVREAVGKHLKRGKIDCNLSYRKDKQGEESIEINDARLNQLLNAATRIESSMNEFQAISPLDILRWPGIQSEVRENLEPVYAVAMTLLNEALAQLVESREREGAEITNMVDSRCGLIQEQMLIAKTRLPEVQAQLREKLQKKINDLLEEPEQARLEQELVYFLQKMDVEEELDRLEAHVKEVRRILGQEEPVGRRLDFLMQELNREANTLGSKSADVQTTNVSIELKVLIEQMREQIQNIE
ncbi:MAG TPA: YicC family protein [Cycloclasticus sp.]|nr:YicC family protein [Cycloclasticus sp.]HIL91823.1 YicC family protein [Cycloclasticus sp.]